MADCPIYRHRLGAKAKTQHPLNIPSKVRATPVVPGRAEVNVAYLVPKAKLVTQTFVYTQVESWCGEGF